MERLCNHLLAFILERVSDDRDRKSCSEVCKLWYTIEALTRVRVRVRVRLNHPDQIRNFLCRFTNMTTLIVDTKISDQSLVFVSRTFPKLRTLDLSSRVPFVVDFGEEGLSAVAAGCRDLREVSLHWRPIGDSGVIALLNNARNLTALDLSGCYSITDLSLKAADGMGSLLRLNLSSCSQVTDRGLDYLTNGSASKSLKVLDVSSLHITDVAICGLKRLSFLEELNLRGCSQLTDVACVAVASIYCLRKLDISLCSQITHNALIAVAAGMGSLSELRITHCPIVTDCGLDLLSSGPAARCLRVLDISFCKHVTDVGVCFLKRLSSLEELILGRCSGGELTDVAGFAVASISSLRKLDLSRQNRITNATLFAVANNCRNLVEIGLEECAGALDQGLLYLASHLPLERIHMPQLGYLDQFSLLYVRNIAEQCPSLKLLKLEREIKRRLSPSQLETLSGMCKLVGA